MLVDVSVWFFYVSSSFSVTFGLAKPFKDIDLLPREVFHLFCGLPLKSGPPKSLCLSLGNPGGILDRSLLRSREIWRCTKKTRQKRTRTKLTYKFLLFLLSDFGSFADPTLSTVQQPPQVPVPLASCLQRTRALLRRNTKTVLLWGERFWGFEDGF